MLELADSGDYMSTKRAKTWSAYTVPEGDQRSFAEARLLVARADRDGIATLKDIEVDEKGTRIVLKHNGKRVSPVQWKWVAHNGEVKRVEGPTAAGGIVLATEVGQVGRVKVDVCLQAEC